MALSEPDRLTLVLRYADLGIATYASLRIVGQPSRTVTWVLEEPLLLAALQELTAALPEPHGAETRRDAIDRALTTGPFAGPDTELTVAYILGVLLIGTPGWQLLAECVASPRAVLFVSPSARLARVPWAPSWPYELLIFPEGHVADLPAAGPRLRAGLAAIRLSISGSRARRCRRSRELRS